MTGAGKETSKTRRQKAERRHGKPGRRGVASNEIVYMTSTEAQNGFGRVLETVARNGTVFITKHNANQAVVMSVENYEALTARTSPNLDTLTAEFDQLLAGMQTPAAKEALRAAFRASAEELGEAALEAAQRYTV